jgi:hypothetical protein
VLRFTEVTLVGVDDPARVLKLDVYETVSPDVARTLLIELLTGFQALPDKLPVSQGVGDAEISLPGDRVLLFTRGNLAIVVANAGEQPQPVSEIARSLDTFLIAPPRAGEPVRMTAARTERSEADPMLKYTAESGVLRQQEDGSVALEGGAQSHMAFVLDEPGDAWHPVEAPGEGDNPAAGARPRRRTKR